MKKFDKGYFYYSFFSALRTTGVVLFLFGGNILNDENMAIEDLLAALPFFGIGSLVLYLALVLYAWLYVRTSGYALTEDDIRCKRGVLFRKSSILPYNKIHAVNKKQGLIQRLFGIATLTVDSGATTNAFSAEITIIEKDEIIDRLIAGIRCRQEGTPVTDDTIKQTVIPPSKQHNLYTFTSKLKVMYSLLTVCGTLFFVIILCVFAAIGLGVAAYLLRSAPDFSVAELLLGGVFFAVLIMVLLGIVSLLGGLVTSFTAYHDFSVYKNKRDIEINYGLFVRHTNNFKFGRIKAVKITDGPIKRLFGYAAATLEVVGYGADNTGNNEDSQSAVASGMLLPLCKQKDIDNTIATILPSYRPDRITHRAKSYPAFILWSFFGTVVAFVSVFMLVLCILLLLSVSATAIMNTALVFVAALVVSLLCVAIFGYFEYRCAGLTIGDKKLTLQFGTFVRTRSVIRCKDIVAIERITTPKRQARGICSYKIHFFTNALTNTVTVKNMDATLAKQLEDSVTY